MKKICVLAVARSGTSFLVDVWKYFEHHASLGEIFHKNAAHKCKPFLPELGRTFGVKAESVRDQDLVAAMRQAPWTAISALERGMRDQGYESFSFKVFPQHLKRPDLHKMFKDHDFTVVFVRRRPIDSFISSIKATELRTWGKQNTTGLTVTLDYEKFSKWHRNHTEWYVGMREFLNGEGIAYGELLYETDIHTPPEQVLKTSQDVLKTLGTELPLQVDHTIEARTKQDQASSYGEKVSNWDEFLHQVTIRDEAWKLSEYF